MKKIYEKERRQEVGMTLYLHNEMVIKKICEGGNKSGLYDQLKMRIIKRQEKNDSKVKLIIEDGETIDYERD